MRIKSSALFEFAFAVYRYSVCGVASDLFLRFEDALLLLLFGKGIQGPRTELEGGEAIQTVSEDAFTAVIPDVVTIFEL